MRTKRKRILKAGEIERPLLPVMDQSPTIPIELGPRTVLFVVAVPGPGLTAKQIQKTAHAYVSSGRFSKCAIEHQGRDIDGKAVESLIMRYGSDEYPPGTWLVGFEPIEEWWQHYMAEFKASFAAEMKALVSKTLKKAARSKRLR